jgi:membrane protein implicated in regulation of membrane protease activity
MQWWAWITIGAILLGVELAFIDAQFYLLFIGISGMLVGLLKATGLLGGEWLEWAAFTVISLTLVLGFRKPIYGMLKRKLPESKIGPAGDVLICPSELPPGASCRLEYRGSSWSVLNNGSLSIPAGAKARIDRVDGLTLVVHGDA